MEEISEKESLIYKLKNVLRGDAMMIKESKSISPNGRRERMQVIEDMKHFLDDYDKNMQIFKDAKIASKKNQNIER